MLNHLQVKIFGKVQGVSFRYYGREKARELGLKGFVRNEPDGTAYFEVEGEEENLKKFLEWCRKGPDTAYVEKVEFMFSTDMKKFDEFKVV
jgi:acylphosphatase